MQLAEASRGIVRLSVPTAFLRQWINGHYRDLIDEFWKQADPSVLKVEIVVRSAHARRVTVVEDDRRDAPAATAARPARAAAQHSAGPHRRAGRAPAARSRRALGAAPDRPRLAARRRYTFDSFVEGPSNRVAFAAAQRVAEASSNAVRFNPLFIHASVGLGKTHLLQAIAAEALRARPASRASST